MKALQASPHPKILASHLRRQAVIYVRQSSLVQVETSLESGGALLAEFPIGAEQVGDDRKGLRLAANRSSALEIVFRLQPRPGEQRG